MSKRRWLRIGILLLALAGGPAVAAVHAGTRHRGPHVPDKPPPVVRESNGPFAVVIQPGSGQTLVADPRSRMVDVRVWVGGIDPGWPPCGGGGQYPCWLDVLLDGRRVAHLVKDSIPNDYTSTLTRVRVGLHVLVARSLNAHGVIRTSIPAWFVVSRAPAASRTMTLHRDLVLSGGRNLVLRGRPGVPVRILGNGHRIVSARGWSGRLVLDRVEVRGLGGSAQGAHGIDVVSPRGVSVTRSVFQESGTIHVGVTGAAPLTVANNTFGENMTVPVNEQPTSSDPAVLMTGGSHDQIDHNRVGLSWLEVDSAPHAAITNNVVIGLRGGIHVTSSPNVTVSGDYSDDRYYGGYSQGLNLELANSPGILVTRSVIRGSSWPVRGLDGELRDCLVMEAGHNWIMAPADGARIDHDIFVQNRAQILYAPEAGAWLLYNRSASFWNDTFDVGGPTMGWYGDLVLVDSGSSLTSFRNNLVTGFPFDSSRGLAPGPNGAGSARNVGYNDFWQPYQSGQHDYAIPIAGGSSHDLGHGGHGVDPLLAHGTTLPFPFTDAQIWSGAVTVTDVLAHYRALYSPRSGSPLLGRGDPADGPGSFIGAVGDGSSPGDTFGR